MTWRIKPPGEEDRQPSRCFAARRAASTAGLGDASTASVKEASPDAREEGCGVKAVIVLTVKEHRRKDGIYISSTTTPPVYHNDQREPVGTRVFGPRGPRVASARLIEPSHWAGVI